MQLLLNVFEIFMLNYSLGNKAIKMLEHVNLQNYLCWNVYFTKLFMFHITPERQFKIKLWGEEVGITHTCIHTHTSDPKPRI